MNVSKIRLVALFAVVVTFAVELVTAGDVAHVKVTGLHLCCRGCCAAVEEALNEIEGVNDIQVAMKAKTVEFTLPNDAALDGALKALHDAGFSGQATRCGREIEFPGPKLEADTQSTRVVFAGVHLCCAGCAKAVAKALESETGVIAVDCKLKERTVTLIGKDLEPAVLLTALNKAGFHGKLRK